MTFFQRIVCICILSLAFIAALPAQAASGDDAEQAQSSMEKMKKQWTETMDALGSYTAAQRDKALKAGRETLDAMDKRIEKMEAWTQQHWDSLSEDARQKRTEMLGEMRQKRNEVAEWYGGMKHSSSEAWDSVKQGFIKSYGELQKAYGEAAQSFQSGDSDKESASQ